MSMLAARTLRTTLAKMEATLMLISNHERVVQDITNPKTENIDGKPLTQVHLKRVDNKHKESVSGMIKAVGWRLLGQGVAGPLTAEEALVWVEAAEFFSSRIQDTPEQKPGRAPDMSSLAAMVLR